MLLVNLKLSCILVIILGRKESGTSPAIIKKKKKTWITFSKKIIVFCYIIGPIYNYIIWSFHSHAIWPFHSHIRQFYSHII